MAKWGQGDPRWIVEDRPDATNVNNWHWTEKNASQWSKDKLTELLSNLKVENDVGMCEISEVTSCEGEAVANNRKAKLIFFYEWVVKMKWKGHLQNSDEEVKGTIEIPNLSEEHEPKDVDINCSAKTTGKEAEVLKEMMRTFGAEKIRQQLEVYINSLTKEFSQGMILPTKEDHTVATNVLKPTNPVQCTKVNGVSERKKTVEKCVRIETAKLTMTEKLKCTAEEFYNAMTVKEMVQAFTMSSCILEAEKGGKFQLFDGNVSGIFTELIPSKQITQKWRFKNWPEGHFSNVVIDINQKEDCTEVTLTQTSIPKSDLDTTKEGWTKYYWSSMKRVFGFGAMLL